TTSRLHAGEARGLIPRRQGLIFSLIESYGPPNFQVKIRGWVRFPAFLEFAQRQAIGRVAIDFVRGSKNERRFWRKSSRCLKQIQRPVRIHGEISLWVARSPVV